MNLPNRLTLLRLILVPLLVLFFNFPYFRTTAGSMLLALFFIAISLTDLVDGYLARRRSQVTSFGKFLDPVADKILVISVLILLVEEGRLQAWMAIIIISRDFIVTGLRLVASHAGVVMAAESIGKYKMFFQILSICFLILIVDARFYFYEIGVALLILSIILSLYSAGQYFLKYGVRMELIKTQ
jgi:CDP-diacylglycerol--glycerol-3-phosphate 3-phosphatidyltransferase